MYLPWKENSHDSLLKKEHYEILLLCQQYLEVEMPHGQWIDSMLDGRNRKNNMDKGTLLMCSPSPTICSHAQELNKKTLPTFKCI